MTPAIVLHNITKLYGQLRAVDDFSLAVERGQIFGLLGPKRPKMSPLSTAREKSSTAFSRP